MLAMASLGAKVLQMRSVELACKHNLPIRVLSTFNDGPGTLVTFEDKIPEKRAVSGIAFSREEAILALSGVPNTTGMANQIQAIVNQANIEIDMIAQNSINTTHADFTFTVQRKDYPKTLQLMQKFADEVGANTVKSFPNVAKLSLVGLGVRSQNGVASTLYKALGETNINIQMITTSDIKISVVVDETCLERGVRAVHQAFELDKTLPDKQPTHVET
jgi:aspartate kinase